MLQPSVEVSQERGVLVAEFWDCLRLDPQPVKDLQAHYEAHRRAGGRADLVVDFHGVSFAGSAALSGFISLRKAVVAAGGRLVLCRLEPAVLDAFVLLRLDPLFRFFPGKAEALAWLDEPERAAPSPAPARPGASSASAPPLRSRRKPG